MRRLAVWTVGMLLVFLLPMAVPPATAQLADPLRPAAAGVLLPFFSNTSAGFLSILEVVSPVVAPDAANPLHLVFFTATCTRNSSLLDDQTAKQAKFYVSTASLLSLNFDGLAAIARPDFPFDLKPLRFPIHARTHWIDVRTGRVRALEPIILDTFFSLLESDPVGLCSAGPTTPPLASTPFNGVNNGLCWNPLSSAATFVTPQDTDSQRASIVLVCPRATIQSNVGGGVFRVAAGFPRLVNRDGSFGFLATSVVTGRSSAAVRGRIYDDDETLMRDITVECDCLTSIPVTSLDTVYSLPPTSVGAYTVPVWYTELESTARTNDPITPAPPQHNSFTGYWMLDIVDSATSFFHRMGAASLDNLADGVANPVGNR